MSACFEETQAVLSTSCSLKSKEPERSQTPKIFSPCRTVYEHLAYYIWLPILSILLCLSILAYLLKWCQPEDKQYIHNNQHLFPWANESQLLKFQQKQSCNYHN